MQSTQQSNNYLTQQTTKAMQQSPSSETDSGAANHSRVHKSSADEKAQRFGRGPVPDNIAYVFVFLGSIRCN